MEEKIVRIDKIQPQAMPPFRSDIQDVRRMHAHEYHSIGLCLHHMSTFLCEGLYTLHKNQLNICSIFMLVLALAMNTVLIS